MKNVKRRLFSILAAITLLTLLIFPVNAATTYGYGFASKPITIYADNDFTPIEISQLKEAISIWNNTSVGQVLVYGGQRNLNSFYWMSDGVNGIVKASMGSNPITSMTGTTSPKVNGANIIEADIAINKDLSYTNNSTTEGMFHVTRVYLHELGHVLGLDDVENDNTTVMCEYYTGITYLTTQDITFLDTLY